MADEEQLPGIEELEFTRESVQRLYESASGVNPLRWERAREEIRFEDVVAELTGHRDSVIRCPFHGRDRRPSFNIFNRNNDAFCFGCPDGSQYYDSVTFVSKYCEISRTQALSWLEKTFELPKMDDVLLEDDEDEPGTLRFGDLAEPFILKSARDIQESKDLELAEDYIRIYFTALALEKTAKETSEEDGAEDLHEDAAMLLATVLGKEKVASIAQLAGN